MSVKVWNILEGPFYNPEGGDDCWLLCHLESTEEVGGFVGEISFPSLDAAYQFRCDFEKSIPPMVTDAELV